MSAADQPLSAEELAAEGGSALPDKEVMSLLDLNADLNLALDVAAPVDLAVAANANVAAPIDAAVGANILSVGSTDASLAHQDVSIDQGLTGSAVAHAPQHSGIDQTGTTTGSTTGTTTPAPAPAPVPDTTATPATPTSALSGDLLKVDVNVAADAKLAAPIDGAVAANANVAAPIDASVSANIGSVASDATAIADQHGSITQHLDGTAQATADQTSQINQ
ncbi:peptidoglycan-binding protein [Nostocoides sp. HKS02]|uniref:peptidoglycan-binding protein n=1 Tax=Nostocoides sp. HKS02 TaxID=1813880 RepID=UPI0012B4A439|nr:peptidoglycan-binding protein [Tetrasphaera sp. HKS02]QGN58721.1 peptidoglycan-binding protein [Tetrasphaera sp. HKS02]